MRYLNDELVFFMEPYLFLAPAGLLAGLKSVFVTTFENFDEVIASSDTVMYLMLAAVVLVFFNFLFKLTAAPFHF